jgi:hypothetical protein
MQDFFRCRPGMEANADAVADKCCHTLVTNLHYEARVQAIINYHATVLGERVNKEQARTMRLTREQYLEVSTLVVVDIND